MYIIKFPDELLTKFPGELSSVAKRMQIRKDPPGNQDQAIQGRGIGGHADQTSNPWLMQDFGKIKY